LENAQNACGCKTACGACSRAIDTYWKTHYKLHNNNKQLKTDLSSPNLFKTPLFKTHPHRRLLLLPRHGCARKKLL
jgi:hypothetical protein